MDYISRIVCDSGMKLAVVLDANASPPWVSRRFPDGLAMDAKGMKRGSASFFHGDPRALQQGTCNIVQLVGCLLTLFSLSLLLSSWSAPACAPLAGCSAGAAAGQQCHLCPFHPAVVQQRIRNQVHSGDLLVIMPGVLWQQQASLLVCSSSGNKPC
jgi:hypothetical protein